MILDLYAGPGGWDVAARDLGLHPVGYEYDADACATRAAAGHRTIRQDVATAWVPPHDGLIASPPCQAFSTAGNGDGMDDLGRIYRWAVACARGWVDDPTGEEWADERSKHVLQPLRWAWFGQPDWIALEQVRGCLPIWECLLTILEGWGYEGWTGLLDAADYGVPQNRTRAVLCASRTRRPPRPEVTHVDPRKGPSLLHQPWVSMADALGWGPDLDVVRGEGMLERHGQRRTHPRNEPAPAVTSRGNRWKWVDRRTNSRGADGTVVPTVPVSTDRPSPTVTGQAGAQWVFRNNNTENACVRPLDRPAGTIYCGARSNALTFEGPDGSRNAELHELAVLQGFPDDYPFQGTKSARAQQIGNAVPPPLAAAVLATVTGGDQ